MDFFHTDTPKEGENNWTEVSGLDKESETLRLRWHSTIADHTKKTKCSLLLLSPSSPRNLTSPLLKSPAQPRRLGKQNKINYESPYPPRLSACPLEPTPDRKNNSASFWDTEKHETLAFAPCTKGLTHPSSQRQSWRRRRRWLVPSVEKN